MKTYLKTFAKMFKQHLPRLLSIILMVLVSVGFTAGIGMSTEKMALSLHAYYVERNVCDLNVMSTRETGFSEDEIALLEQTYGKENMLLGFTLEIEDGKLEMGSIGITLEGVGEGITRVYCFPEFNITSLKQNLPEVAEDYHVDPSSLTQGQYLAWAERETAQLKGVERQLHMTASVGAFTISHTYVLGGTVLSPLHFATRDDKSFPTDIPEDADFAEIMESAEDLENILYIFDCPPITGNLINDIFITLPQRGHVLFSGAYEKEVRGEAEKIEAQIQDCNALTLYENYSFSSYHEFGTKIQGIGYVLTAVFLLVTLLVVLSTMTRLLEEERSQLACLQTLGYAPWQILSKYFLFALAGTAIGAFGAYFAGEALSYVIYINFAWNYSVPPYSPIPCPLFFILSATVILASTLLATLITGLKKTRETPAVLLRPRPPKAGRKVLLEKIPLLWNRLSFRYKSTVRNIFRYKTRFFMTVVSVMASTALVVAGLAVLDCCIFQEIGTAAMIGVAVIVLVFAALLNAVVIYTLTCINISERSRELATLMVLGYTQKEVAGYVYREIYITGSIGILLGLPFGSLLCLFIFNLMSFGSLGGISWYVWLVAPVMALFFTFVVTLMLSRKITRLDMNESLKAVE